MNVIIKSNEGYWSNDIGWVGDKESATLFGEYELTDRNLPIGENVTIIEA